MVQDLNSNGTLIEVMIYGNLLTSLIDERVIEVSDAIFSENVRWGEQATLAKFKMMEATRSNPLQIGMELQLTWPLRESLVRLVKWLSRK